MSGALTEMLTEWLGWLAAGLTLMSFFCRDVLHLRCLALGANASFIGFGLLAGIAPVLALHLMLVPLNLWRLRELRQRR